jgi:putative transposase
MPWSETGPMDQRLQFIADAQRDEHFSNVCRRYGIGRKTGYKWYDRYATQGVERHGLIASPAHASSRGVPALC